MIPQSKKASLQSISREVDWAWLAGIIDGEGNFVTSLKCANNGKFYFMPKIRIANTDIRMIARISEIYEEANVVFFYTLANRKKYRNSWKNYFLIEVASQGSSRKVLEWTIPYLVAKKKLAQIMLEMIVYVQGFPKGGNTSSYDYGQSQIFIDLQQRYEIEKNLYVDPSTIKRTAGRALVLPDDMI